MRCFRNFRSNFEIFQSKILKNSDERYRFLKINRSVPALAIVYTTMVAYANLYPKNELSWSNDRLLLTVTAMFAYHREMRWIWLWLVQIVSIMFFSNNRTISKHFKYLSESFQANMALYRVLQISEILWTLSLSSVVIFIGKIQRNPFKLFPMWLEVKLEILKVFR